MKKKIILSVLIILVVLTFIGFNFLPKIVTAGSAKLSWNKNSETDVAGYKIYYGARPRTGDCPPGGYEKNIDVRNNFSFTVNNLDVWKTYYFSVTSYNFSGKESCFSQEMQKKISLSAWNKITNFFGRFKK